MLERLPQVRWKQDGVTNVWKLLPGNRIGVLSDELMEEEKAAGGVVSEKIQAIRSGDAKRVRRLQEVEGKDITTRPLEQWEEQIPGAGGAIATSICRPTDRKTDRSCVLYLHGGGWQYGRRAIVEPACRYLADLADAVTVWPDYRLAPENPWPAGLEDCWSVLNWIHANAEKLGIHPGFVYVAGDSAGGNLAALCSHRDRDEGFGRIRGQILYYAALAVGAIDELKDYRFSAEDYICDESQRDILIPKIKALYFASNRSKNAYLPENVDNRNPQVSPIFDSSFRGLPATLLITAQYDFLTQQNRTYAKYLAEAGVPVTWINYCGVTHAFVDKCGVLPQAGDSIMEAANFIREQRYV